MSINNTLNSIESGLLNAYTSLENKGASIPTNKNFQNLYDTINSLSVYDTYLFQNYTDMETTSYSLQNKYGFLYGSGNIEMTESSSFQTVYFPDAVTLDTGITVDQIQNIETNNKGVLYDNGPHELVRGLPTEAILGTAYLVENENGLLKATMSNGIDSNVSITICIQVYYYDSYDNAQNLLSPTNSFYVKYTSLDGITFNRVSEMPERFVTDFSATNLSGNIYTFKTTLQRPEKIIYFSKYDFSIIPKFIRVVVDNNVVQSLKYYNNGWNSANTQLSATSRYVWEQTFFGENGFERGTLQDINYIPDRSTYNIYANLQNSLSNLTPASTNMAYVFDGYDKETVPTIDTYNVTDFTGMFNNCTNLINIPSFNTDSATSLNNMFSGANNLSNASIHNIINSLPNYTNLTNPTTNNLSYLGLDINNLPTINKYVACDAINKGWDINDNVDFYKYIVTYTTSTNSTPTTVTIQETFDNLETTDNGPLLRSYFNSIKNASTNIIDIVTLSIEGSGHIQNMSSMFNCSNNYSKFTYMTELSYINTDSAIYMSSMFEYCNNLTSVPNFNTSNVTSMSSMFESCNNLTTVPNFNTSNVTSMRSMFSSCFNLSEVPNFNTSKAIYMNYMFSGCSNLTAVPNFNTSNVINMSDMFSSCSNLSEVPNFNTSKVTDMSGMFASCDNLTTVPNFNTSNVTDMGSMFYFCSNLTTIPEFDTSNVTDMRQMFIGCWNLTSVPNLNTSKAIYMRDMFYSCYNLSAESYATIANMLPLAANLTNQYISNIRIECK